ncbi:hypothetical protein BDA96_10G295400 [Sorghum bicolor]|uniref:Secreted protein n=1 Tax=Sorghum bicolor TaxID=4558 RepID=A0A921Q5X9_SORBI|nr:hypothetical protein BDA96_10G295400 [Sorghum bicolor]
MNHGLVLVAVAVPWCPGKVGGETPVDRERPHKQRQAGEVLLRAVPVVFGTSESAGDEARRLCLPCCLLLPSGKLCFGSPRLTPPRRDETRRYAFPVPIATSPRGSVTGPRRAASDPGTAYSPLRQPPPWCGQWKKIELLVLPWQAARTQTFLWVASVVCKTVSLDARLCDPGSSSSFGHPGPI